jgi:hypothetical protein
MNGNNFYTGVAREPDLSQGDITSQVNAAKVEELKAKQTGALPDPLSKIDPIISNIFSDFINVKGMLKQANRNPKVNKHVIKSLNSRVDKINKLVLDLYDDLSKLSI